MPKYVIHNNNNKLKKGEAKNLEHRNIVILNINVSYFKNLKIVQGYNVK